MKSQVKVCKYSESLHKLICHAISIITASLRSWKISDGDSFYVMLRSKEQPGVQKFATLPELDHEIGIRYMCILRIYQTA